MVTFVNSCDVDYYRHGSIMCVCTAHVSKDCAVDGEAMIHEDSVDLKRKGCTRIWLPINDHNAVSIVVHSVYYGFEVMM